MLADYAHISNKCINKRTCDDFIHVCSAARKRLDHQEDVSLTKVSYGEKFEDEMLIMTQPKTSLQSSLKKHASLSSYFQSIIGSVDTIHEEIV